MFNADSITAQTGKGPIMADNTVSLVGFYLLVIARIFELMPGYCRHPLYVQTTQTIFLSQICGHPLQGFDVTTINICIHLVVHSLPGILDK